MIGNGFDLAHGLPTRYKDFLEFCEKATLIYEEELNGFEDEYNKRYLHDWSFNDTIKQLLNQAFQSKVYENLKWTTANLYLNELYECIQNNFWYEYFKLIIRNKQYNGENWIDFESEIARAIKEIEVYHHAISSGQSINGEPQIFMLYPFICKKKAVPPVATDNIKGIDSVISTLYEDLNRLTRALEIYLSVFVSAIEINKPIADLEGQKFDYVLSFNYTDTYERVFREMITNKTEICYLHGKANKDAKIESCNLVLGIDEYLSEEQRNIELTFLSFKKFYQRIYKCTDNSYSNWLDEICDSTPCGQRENEFELHIFGHSLDITDKDILEKFILNDNVQTKIYYYQRDKHDKSDFSSKIRNLIKIIKQDKLIERTGGGSKNTIEFIPQNIGN